jgi:hypothetical protein
MGWNVVTTCSGGSQRATVSISLTNQLVERQEEVCWHGVESKDA